MDATNSCEQAFIKCPAVSAGLLERLDLADNTLGGDGAQALADALSSQPLLVYVNLRDCDLQASVALTHTRERGLTSVARLPVRLIFVPCGVSDTRDNFPDAAARCRPLKRVSSRLLQLTGIEFPLKYCCFFVFLLFLE